MIKYKVVLTKKAKKELFKLDVYDRKLLVAWIEKNLVNCADPRLHGKLLTGNLANKWRYRVGNFRILADINDNLIIIYVINIGHRKDIYNF